MVAVQGPRGSPLRREHQLTASGNRRAFLAAAYGHAGCHASKLALPLVTLTAGAQSFDVTIERFGWTLTAFTLGMGASSVPAGLMGDRFGTGRVLTAYFWALALAAVACSQAQGFVPFLVAHAALGCAAGLFHPAGLGLISLVTPGPELGRAMGLFGVAGSVGLAFMPLAMGSALGWRAGFLMLAGAGVVGALACHHGLRTGWLPAGAGAAPTAMERVGARNDKLLGLLLVIMGVNAFVAAGWEAIFPQTVADQGLVALEDWHITTLVLVVGGVGQYVGGLLARDSFAAARLAVILVVQCLVLLGTATALDRGMLPFMFLMSFAFLNYGTQPIENKLLAAFTSSRRRATAYSLKFLVALLVAAPAPWIVARLYDGASLPQPSFRMLSVVTLVAVFAGWLFLKGSRGKKAAGSAA